MALLSHNFLHVKDLKNLSRILLPLEVMSKEIKDVNRNLKTKYFEKKNFFKTGNKIEINQERQTERDQSRKRKFWRRNI